MTCRILLGAARETASTYAVVTCDDVSGRVLRHSMETAPIRRELRLVLVDGQLMIYYDYCISCFWWGRSFLTGGKKKKKRNPEEEKKKRKAKTKNGSDAGSQNRAGCCGAWNVSW